MDGNDLYQSLSESVEKFGIYGNQSLEYIGLTIRSHVLISQKLYFLPTVENATMPSWSIDLYNRYFGRLTHQSSISICDISESYYGQIPSYRLVLKVNKLLSVAQIEHVITSFAGNIGKNEIKRLYSILSLVRLYNNMEHSPIIEIGVEVDHSFKYLSLKYYLTLRPDPTRKPVIRPETKELLESIQRLTNNKFCITYDLLQNIESYNYYPFFIGINDNGDAFESKLYYMSALMRKDVKNKALEQINEISSLIGLSSEYQKVMIEILEDKHLYMEGIAITSENPSIFRIYLKEISRRYFKNINQD